MAQQHQTVLPRLLKGLFVAFVLASFLRGWVGPPELLPRAQAQIPNAGDQRIQLLQTARETNRLLGEILATLREGTLNVRQAGTDNNGDGATGRGPAIPPR